MRQSLFVYFFMFRKQFPQVMKVEMNRKIILGGALAGAVAGIFGAGGGLILVPLLAKSGEIDDEALFPTSVCIILPICMVTLLSALQAAIPLLSQALPYLIGSFIGGIAASALREKIPTAILHRLLGGMIIWGGFRYLCS